MTTRFSKSMKNVGNLLLILVELNIYKEGTPPNTLDKTVRSGDLSNPFIILIMFIIAGVGNGVFAVTRRRRSKRKCKQ